MSRSKDQDFLDKLADHLRASQGDAVAAPQTNGHRPATVEGPSDEAIIEKCRSAENAAKFVDLFDLGDVHTHHGGDDSTADLSLLGILKFYTRDAAQLERLFSASALGHRSKWRDRDDYRRRTLYRALRDPGETYDWGRMDSRRLLSSSANSLRDSSDDDNNEEDLDRIVWFAKRGDPPDREYLIESVAVKKYPVVAYGAGGVAKSFAMLAAGIAIAGDSQKWLGLEVLDHGHVLYLDFELDEEEQHRRVRDLCAGLGVAIPEKLAYFSALGVTTEAAFKKAHAFVNKYGAKAVIIDSMGLAMAGDMDRARDVIAFHRQYIDPLRKSGTTPFVVDHEGKLQAGENRKDKGPIGSAFKAHVTRSVLQFTLEEYDEENSALDIRVRQHKTNFKPTKPFGVRFAFEEAKVSIEAIDLSDTELIDEAYVPVKGRIVAALKPGEATIRELGALTGAETGTIRNKLSELKNEERVIDAGYRGREKLYALPCSPDFVTRDEPQKAQNGENQPGSLLSSSVNAYRETGDDDNEDAAQAELSENKRAQTTPPVSQGASSCGLEEFLGNPPDWLARQLEKCRVDPERYLKPTAASLAYEAYGTASRWEEVLLHLEARLKEIQLP